MKWYYAINGAQQGPVDETELRRLFAQAVVAPETMVWNDTLPEWTPLRAALPGVATLPAGHARCIVTGLPFPESEMFMSEHGWVSAEAKGKYYQSLREGIAPNRDAVGTYTAWRDGAKMVIPVSDAALPPRCVKTNASVQPGEIRRRTFYWAPSWVLATILLGWIITLVLYFALRKKVVVPLPLSAAAEQRARVGKFGGLLLFVAGFVTMIAGFVNIDSFGGLLAIGGIVAVLAALVVSMTVGRSVTISSVKGAHAWVQGVHPDFLASLPTYRP